MKQFDELMAIIDRLLGPGGCPWDQEQTLVSLRPSVLEEACELIEAIDLNDNHMIQEELGDLLFNAAFFCKIAEKEHKAKLSDVIAELNAKLVRRHPHVFGDGELKTAEEVVSQWDKIKNTEKGKEHRKSALDSIPKGLPALSRANKMVKKFKKADYSFQTAPVKDFKDEQELGEQLWALASKANAQGLDAEHALRKVLSELERDFRNKEVAEK